MPDLPFFFEVVFCPAEGAFIISDHHDERTFYSEQSDNVQLSVYGDLVHNTS